MWKAAQRFEGTGVYYAATPAEGHLCDGADVIVVGGGNSAGQAAVFLAMHARQVLILIRGDDLYKNMSSYLVHRIEQTPNIELRCNTTIRRLQRRYACAVGGPGEQQDRRGAYRGGAGCVQFHRRRSAHRLAAGGNRARREGLCAHRCRTWRNRPRGRRAACQPFLLETSRPGVFAAGDVRAGSVKRVASAVGEGSMAVQFVHERLKHM